MEQGIKTIKFMVIVSVVFIAVLATINEVTKARIDQNFEIEQAKSMLYAFNIFPEGYAEDQMASTNVTADIPGKKAKCCKFCKHDSKNTRKPIPESLQQELQGTFLQGQTSLEIYAGKNDQGEVTAYGLPLYGKGLWGTIEGFGVISADLKTMIGIDFTKQVETPGLGARIIEKEYKYFFRNLDLSGFFETTAGQKPVIMVKDKEQTNIESSTNSVEAVTGATQTSHGVLEMVNNNFAAYLKILQAYKEQA